MVLCDHCYPRTAPHLFLAVRSDAELCTAVANGWSQFLPSGTPRDMMAAEAEALNQDLMVAKVPHWFMRLSGWEGRLVVRAGMRAAATHTGDPWEGARAHATAASTDEPRCPRARKRAGAEGGHCLDLWREAGDQGRRGLHEGTRPWRGERAPGSPGRRLLARAWQKLCIRVLCGLYAQTTWRSMTAGHGWGCRRSSR